MSRERLDLRRSARILWRHRILFAACALIGLVGNATYAMLQPQVFTSNSLVILGSSVNLDTQTVVVDSVPVLTDALHRAPSLGSSIWYLQWRVKATRSGAETISISAWGSTASWAQTAANAVSAAYVTYITSERNPVGKQSAQLFLPATTPTVKPLTTRLAEAGVLGLMAGIGVGLIAALAIGRTDRRLRERDAIADSIGVPVLASLPVKAPTRAAGWARILDVDDPSGAVAWQLRKVLRDLSGAGDDAGAEGSRPAGGPSVAVVCVASDQTALALGPQLAAFAAARGIPTELVIPPPPDAKGRAAKVVAALNAACMASAAMRSGNLRVSVRDGGHPLEAPRGTLVVSAAVVDGQAPRVAETPRTAVTLLAVTSGAVTAEQLVRVSASAAGDGRVLAGLLVANPLPADETTGRVPELARPEQYRMPTRTIGVVTESR